ncbi:uncharacterized protein LOC111430504 [Cucurbita moschata]|uniref:Uncharacterized protein LOC111430504 n=1 Tax=Cucurbita moschata TaxID=3662 RepID=A0A6J1E3J8_CUCMO|nr:uncharacterized protein LOC111430504 [Cucurbita moschata]
MSSYGLGVYHWRRWYSKKSSFNLSGSCKTRSASCCSLGSPRRLIMTLLAAAGVKEMDNSGPMEETRLDLHVERECSSAPGEAMKITTKVSKSMRFFLVKSTYKIMNSSGLFKLRVLY